MSFSLSEVIHMVSTIDDLLSMIGHEYSITTSTSYNVEDEENIEFIKFSFPLKQGTSHVKIYNSTTGVIIYEKESGEILKTLEFDNRNVASLTGSFKKSFKQIREFDRQQVGTTQSTNPTIDRASFGLADVN